MVRISEDSANVVGDCLEACLYSRHLAEDLKHMKEITHYTTGEYGGFYFDEIKDDSYCILFLSKDQLTKILRYIPNLKYKAVLENHLRVPVKKIKFSSSYDEHITFPINRNSFELEIDYQDSILKKYTYEQFIEEYKSHKNITRLMKSVFSESFYLNIIKKISCNQWNTNQSQIDPSRLYHMLHLNQLDSTKQFEYYFPVEGISSLCKELLNHPKIKVAKESRNNTKKIIKSQTNKVTYIAEYVDYYLDFMFGGFDYMISRTETHGKSLSESTIFRTYTPFDKKYYMYFGTESTVYKIWNTPKLITSHSFNRMCLVPSISNYRKLVDYRKVSNVSRNLKILL